MRKSLGVVLVTCVLILGFPSVGTTSHAFAQRKTARSSKVAPSLATQRGVDTIATAQLKDYLTFIASDEMEGRDTPSRGLDTTAKFLAMNLSRWGFKPAGDPGSFLQKIALSRDVIDRDATHAELNGQTLNLGEDYIPFARSCDIPATQLIFAGSGWYVKSKNIDAYKGLDAKGKIAVIFTPPNTLPRGITSAMLTGKRGEDWMSAGEYAEKQGVAGLIIIPDFQYLANWDRNRARITDRGTTRVDKFQPATGTQIPQIVLSPRVANLLFSGEKRNAVSLFESIYGASQFPESFPLAADKKMSLTVKVKTDAQSTQNVVAIWEGSDPVLKDEYVALGAHYDHVGIGIPVNGDAIYNGADDDGSGTTALLGMAEALSHASVKPKRSILFVWHAGEEKGLWGSRYFTDNPTVPLDKVVTQLNIDMIGRTKKEGDTNVRNRDLAKPGEIFVIGSKMMSTELGELVEKVNQQYQNLEYNYRYDDPGDPNRFFFRSDHYNYARKGIPITFFFDGEHEDYHRPGDEVSKIDFPQMEKVARTIYLTLWEVANRPTRPVVDKQLPAQLQQQRERIQ
ncbi:MAG TPA: M20/M25/M40 family metallo-hydrolase [Pyrinomonadaceae bacterium]|nr:M20/M25/M40 family metallo-hydrolase [Pyrinomonadaceae bacterium]